MKTSARIAILGATGHIAKALIHEFREKEDYELSLFSRSFERVERFLEGIQFKTPKILDYEGFYRGEYDAIINCIGIGDPGKLREFKGGIFQLTEKYDNLVLGYLQGHPQTLYIHFSSGAVYGKEFFTPADDQTPLRLNMNRLGSDDFYGIAKIHAEAKHRAMNRWNIVDLRVFGFFSRFVDPNSKFFLNEVVACLKQGAEFLTGPTNMIRDYINPKDLAFLVHLCIGRKILNDVFDVYSLKPAAKFEILDYFAQNYGLRFRVQDDFHVPTATGSKEHYYSQSRRVEKIGYRPRYTSMDTIIQETQKILEFFDRNP